MTTRLTLVVVAVVFIVVVLIVVVVRHDRRDRQTGRERTYSCIWSWLVRTDSQILGPSHATSNANSRSPQCNFSSGHRHAHSRTDIPYIQCMGAEKWRMQGTVSWHLWPFRQEARLSPAIPSFWKLVTMKRQWLQAGNSSAQLDVPSIVKQHLRNCHFSTLSHLPTQVHCSSFAISAVKLVCFDMAVCLGLQLVAV